jgi:hypothetical protein
LRQKRERKREREREREQLGEREKERKTERKRVSKEREKDNERTSEEREREKIVLLYCISFRQLFLYSGSNRLHEIVYTLLITRLNIYGYSGALHDELHAHTKHPSVGD